MLLQQNSVAHYRARLYECLSVAPGVEFEFVADQKSDTPYQRTAESTGRPIRLTPCPVWTFGFARGSQWFLQPGAIGRLLFGEFDVAIALGSPYSLTTWFMLLLGPLVGTRVLLWTHGLLGPESGPKWWLRSLLYRCSAGLLLYGDRAKALLLAQGLTRTPLFVIRNSLDLEEQRSAEAAVSSAEVTSLRARLGIRAQHRSMIFIGRLQPVKRLELIVRAVGALATRGRQVHALLLGEGEERAALGRLAEEQGVEQFVHFEGARYDEREIAAYFAVSDVCVIPSGAGLTVMHALGYGTPVVTHDRPELQFPEVEAVIPGETGDLYHEGDFDSLVSTLDRCLYPEAMKARVASSCHARIAAEFHPEAHAGRMVDAVLSTARSGGKGG